MKENLRIGQELKSVGYGRSMSRHTVISNRGAPSDRMLRERRLRLRWERERVAG